MSLPTPSRRVLRNIGLADVRAYHLPLPGVVSILHRASGVLLFLALPGLVWLFEQSLASERSFERFQAFAHALYGRVALVVLAWAFLHHFAAGVRFLLLDIHVGTAREAARRSARMVFAVSLPLAALVALYVFGAFG